MHCRVVFLFPVKVVAKLPVNDVLLCCIYVLFLRHVDGKYIEVPLIQELEFLLKCLFMITKNLQSRQILGTVLSMQVELTFPSSV